MSSVPHDLFLLIPSGRLRSSRWNALPKCRQEQRGSGPTVFTYYYPFCDDNPAVARARLMDLQWEECAELVLTDLEQAHPDLRPLVQKLDVMRCRRRCKCMPRRIIE